MNSGICHAPNVIIGRGGDFWHAEQDVELEPEVVGGNGPGGWREAKRRRHPANAGQARDHEPECHDPRSRIG
jgi:hypothetical protein